MGLMFKPSAIWVLVVRGKPQAFLTKQAAVAERQVRPGSVLWRQSLIDGSIRKVES